MWDDLINDLWNDLWDGLINDLWNDLVNDLVSVLINGLMKSDSAVCILLVKAGFDACRWFERWFKR